MNIGTYIARSQSKTFFYRFADVGAPIEATSDHIDLPNGYRKFLSEDKTRLPRRIVHIPGFQREQDPYPGSVTRRFRLFWLVPVRQCLKLTEVGLTCFANNILAMEEAVECNAVCIFVLLALEECSELGFPLHP